MFKVRLLLAGREIGCFSRIEAHSQDQELVAGIKRQGLETTGQPVQHLGA